MTQCLLSVGPPTERGSDEYDMSEPSQKPFFKITRLWKTTKMFSKRRKQTQSTVIQTQGTRIYSNERGSRHPRGTDNLLGLKLLLLYSQIQKRAYGISSYRVPRQISSIPCLGGAYP